MEAITKLWEEIDYSTLQLTHKIYFVGEIKQQTPKEQVDGRAEAEKLIRLWYGGIEANNLCAMQSFWCVHLHFSYLHILMLLFPSKEESSFAVSEDDQHAKEALI